MSLRRGRQHAELNAEINVVSLIDVMMILLVIFMITAPMMQGGVDVNLPSAESKALEPKSGLVVTVMTNGTVYIDEEKFTDSEFASAFRTMVAKRAKDGVYLRGDKDVTYQRLMDIFSVMRRAGVENIGLVTEERQEPGK